MTTQNTNQYSKRSYLVTLPKNLQKLKIIQQLKAIVFETYKGIDITTLKNDLEFIEHSLTLLLNSSLDLGLTKDVKIEDIALELFKDLFNLNDQELKQYEKHIIYLIEKGLIKKIKTFSLTLTNFSEFLKKKVL